MMAVPASHAHPGQRGTRLGYSPDTMLQGRLFGFHDARFYRVGTKHRHLPVNELRRPSRNQQRDGQMAIHNSGAAESDQR